MCVCSQCYRDLTLVNRDGMNVILVKMNQILMEKFLKLLDVPRTQVSHHCTRTQTGTSRLTGIQLYTRRHIVTVVFVVLCTEVVVH